MQSANESTLNTELVKQFEDYLKSTGFRLTQKRLDILNQVFDYPGHFQTEDLLGSDASQWVSGVPTDYLSDVATSREKRIVD